MPYVAHKRLVTVIHMPYHTVYHGGSLLPIRVHARVRPSVLAAEINRIRNLTRPSTESYLEKYLQSRDRIYFDDEAREIRAKVDSLLRRVHVYVPRAVASDFLEEIIPERMRCGDYVRRLLSGKQNAKKDPEPVSWYEVPERGNFGTLACIKYVAGNPQSVRRPYFKVADLRPSDIKNDVNFLSYYKKNRQAAASASTDGPMTERELRKARALEPDVDVTAVKREQDSKPEKKRESKCGKTETAQKPAKEPEPEPTPVKVVELVAEPVKEPEPEPEPVKEPEPEPVKEPEPVPEPVKEPEPVPVKPSKPKAKRAAAPAPAPEPAPAPAPAPEPVQEKEQPAPVEEAKPEPVEEAKPEPVVEAQPEPVVEAQPEPVVEAKPETAEDVPAETTSADVNGKKLFFISVRQDKDEAIKKIEQYLVKAAEEAKSDEERKQAAEDERVKLEMEELKAWEALQAAQERAEHLDEILEQEKAEDERQAEEAKLEADRMETERVLEAERQVEEARVATLLEEQERMIVEEHLEEVRQKEELEARLANVAFNDADEVKDLDHSRDDAIASEITDQEREEKPYELIADDETRIEEENAQDEERLDMVDDPFVEEPEGAQCVSQTGGNAIEETSKIEEVTSGGEESFEWGDEDA
ncbi:Filamentous hemagglutinin [Dufourea novaeangliae]|uniref:Filamentous hemagglutinin n=1 Tax=Dufourea novaeangliae TaxID=178035 RepID=A0A154P3G3_DUFNO|nr:Filamentous hemagglutinin [Dufourea novaeangliae]